MIRFQTLCGLGAALALTACATGPKDVPALLNDPSAAERETLRVAVARATGNVDQALSAFAFTRDSSLSVPLPAMRATPNDRDMRLPDDRQANFRLVKRDDLCVVIHEQFNQAYVLGGVSCAVATPPA